tara:strand:- start:2132 stop:2680 length:549 start_codon:yes stop_codon:yes gene_type:complete
MSIYKKLFEAKKEIGKISKDSKNPFFKSKYFDINSLLEHVEPILQKHDLLLLQPILDGKVITELIDVETGEKVTSEISLPTLNDPQKLGSAVSYYRRYTAQSLLGLQATDDDANLASGKKTPKATPKATTEAEKKWITPEMYEKAKKFAAEDLKKLLLHSVKYKLRPEQKTELERIFNEKNK